MAVPHTGPYGAYDVQPEDFGARISIRVTATAWQYKLTEDDLGAVLSATAEFTAPG